jgi:hypothetical protein
MPSQSRFSMRLVPREFTNPEYESIALVDDIEEITPVDHDSEIDVTTFGPVPKIIMVDHTTAPRCITCGRGPGVVSAPGIDRFDLGVKHALNRLSRLLQERTGCNQAEAESIVLKLRASDVELP